MKHFPAFLDIENRTALVVGNGLAAARKAELLAKAHARVIVVAERPCADLAVLAGEGRITVLREPFSVEHLDEAAVLIVATGSEAEDRQVADAGKAHGVPVNVVDRPGLGTFIVPAVIDRDPVTVAVSSAGTAPVLARGLRAKIEALLPARVGDLAAFAGRFRDSVKAKLPEGRDRLRFWERVFDGPIADHVLAGRDGAARSEMLRAINTPANDKGEDGVVYLVGAGPGDPDLLTIRALRVLQTADVIVHDKLVGPDILNYARRDAERIFVGKTRGDHTKSQDEINEIIAAHARAGKRVARLKGGDPFVFGRGGEEREHLRALGVRVEIVPGITAATGCAAAAGFPLTHRDHASSVTFVTGHAKTGAPDLDWPALATSRHTIVIYMGVATAGLVSQRLMEHGLAGATPVAVVENGTLPNQRVLTGELRHVGGLIAENGIKGPALVVIGDVTAAADAAVENKSVLDLALAAG